MNCLANAPRSCYLVASCRYLASWEHGALWLKRKTTSERERTRRFFDRTSLAFLVIERVVVPEYRELFSRLQLPSQMSVLDLGTGSGALALVMSERGHPVTGFDFSHKLLQRAKRLVPNARFEVRDITSLSEIQQRSYDLVTMAYVLHGMPPRHRKAVLRAAARIARQRVLVIDYWRRGPLFTQFIEWIEGPHYFEFVRRPLADTLHTCGLTICERTRTRTGGGAWLCIPNQRVS